MKHPFEYKIITIDGLIKEGEVNASNYRMAKMILSVRYPFHLLINLKTKTPSQLSSSGYFANLY